MMIVLGYLVVAAYCLSLLFIFLFSLGQLHLTWHYLKAKKNSRVKPPPSLDSYPVVTVQLPVFNEKYVVARLIDAVAKIEYPKDKLEIQVLDDSVDETVAIIEAQVARYAEAGFTIQHIKRANRAGFKAGALQYGLEHSKGEYIAIFDADFLPKPSFLKTTLPHFTNKKVGVVQTRWGHINQDYSILTKLQAFGLDAHFSVEQLGRSHAGSFINFNGTGGVWRKTCIYNSGGWSADTLTEDLDLSYRAQLNGWRFIFLENCVSPAELPVLMPAIKSQQYRWNKGAAETAKKILWKVIGSKHTQWSNKVHAFFHLLNSCVFVCLLIASLCSIPMLFLKNAYPSFSTVFNMGSIFLLGFFSIAMFYWVAAKQSTGKGALKYYISIFPAFLIMSMGLSLHNAWAVLEGFLGIKSSFIRTPKFNIIKKGDAWKKNQYISSGLSVFTVFEGLLSIYFIGGIGVGIYLKDLGLLLFHLMLALGFAAVFYYSVKPLKNG